MRKRSAETELRHMKRERKQLIEVIDDLVASPVVAGMGAAIRDEAKRRGRLDPFAKAVSILKQVRRASR